MLNTPTSIKSHRFVRRQLLENVSFLTRIPWNHERKRWDFFFDMSTWYWWVAPSHCPFWEPCYRVVVHISCMLFASKYLVFCYTETQHEHSSCVWNSHSSLPLWIFTRIVCSKKVKTVTKESADWKNAGRFNHAAIELNRTPENQIKCI